MDAELRHTDHAETKVCYQTENKGLCKCGLDISSKGPSCNKKVVTIEKALGIYNLEQFTPNL